MCKTCNWDDWLRHLLNPQFFIISGAIIRYGDRKSWDARGPMIWDNFSIFRTNCAILTSYNRADPRTCRGLSRGCCRVDVMKWWELRDSLADFSQRWQGMRQRRRTRALLCTFMLWFNGKGVFFRVDNFFNFALWMNKIRSPASYRPYANMAAFIFFFCSYLK